jgi:nitrogen fixation-related uncharacterized protein
MVQWIADNPTMFVGIALGVSAFGILAVLCVIASKQFEEWENDAMRMMPPIDDE